MDEETRRIIRQAELERIHARPGREELLAQRQIASEIRHAKLVAYVKKYGRQKAVLRTLKKWTVAFALFAIVTLPLQWQKDGAIHALSNLLFFPMLGLAIGVYRASKLPSEE